MISDELSLIHDCLIVNPEDNTEQASKYEKLIQTLNQRGIDSISENEIILLKKLRSNNEKTEIYDIIKYIDAHKK